MGRMSFTQELKELAKASEEMEAGGCWREVLYGEWRRVLREAAALMLKPGERSGGRPKVNRRQQRFDRVAADVRWTVEPPTSGWRRRGGAEVAGVRAAGSR